MRDLTNRLKQDIHGLFMKLMSKLDYTELTH